MKRVLRSVVLSAMLFTALPLQAQAAELLIPVGKLIGLQLKNDAVTVVAYDDTCSGAARDGGLKIGDQIIQVNGQRISSAEEVRAAVSSCGEDLELTVRRGKHVSTLRVAPEQTDSGKRLGVYLRQGIAGIGTVTFYDPDTKIFGTLGHGVSDAGGELLQMTAGNAYEASLVSVKKGKSGEPGQLKGSASDLPFASLLRNTPQGVFGKARVGWQGQAMPTAAYEEIKTGPAVIRCQVSGDRVQEYSVEILKIYPQSRPDGRNFLLRITDRDLLDTTGGIVQGMSGSPLIQDGKLIGAVTHVLVNDPTMGYGIFIENMLEAAS